MRAIRIRRTAAVLATVACLGTSGVVAATSQPTPEPVSRAVAWALDARYLGREGVRMQQGKVDCGVAALAMILAHHGRDAGLDAVRRNVLDRGHGLSLLEMQRIAAARGVSAAGWRLDMPALARASLPAVAHFQDHYVVVDRVVPDGTVLIRDPSIGKLELTGARFRELWTGNVLLFHVPSSSAAP
jgi:ABC-type bacteriocin/lantibiotic exporter with double-glycine peptidase domain